MKKLLSILTALMMLAGILPVLADAPQAAIDLARSYVHAGAEFTSTDEDARKLGLTFKDAQANEYKVVLNKSPLFMLRVSMKSPKEEGASSVQLDEATVRERVLSLFPGAVIDSLFLEAKGEDELFVHVLLEREGLLYKVRLNAGNGRMTHYVQRGAPGADVQPMVTISQAYARQLALGHSGGTVTDVEFGHSSRGYLYLIETQNGETRYSILISAQDGSLLGLKTGRANLLPFAAYAAAPGVKPVPVSQDDDWIFDKDRDWDSITQDGQTVPGMDDDGFQEDDWFDDDDDDVNDGISDDDDDDNDGISDDDDDDDNDGISDDDDDDDDNDGISDDDDDDDDDSAAATAKPVETPKPTETAKPAPTPGSDDDDDDDSSSTPKPAETPKPTETAKPTETPKPASTPGSDDDDDDSSSASKPAETPKPTETPKPAETPKPTETAKPTETPAPEATPDQDDDD